MKVLFNLPSATLARCFRKVDLSRLAVAHELILPPTPLKGGVFEAFAASGKLPDTCSDIADLERLVCEHIGTAEAMITGWGTPLLSARILDAAPKLKVLVHAAGSVRGIVPNEVFKRGIRVGTCNGALAVGVAETTLGMIIAGLKGLFPARDWTRSGGWHDTKLGTNREVLREPFGVTVGVISASKVGLHLLKLLRAFELEVLLYDPFVRPSLAGELGATIVELGELVTRSEVVTLHTPLLPATHHMLKREHFRSMKDGAVFINTARGAIVDEVAMIEELKTGRISAFLDVTDPEPPTKDNPLRTLPNVVLTPHLSGHASNGCFRQGRSAVDQVLEFAAGIPMHGEVTRAMLSTMG